MSINLKELFGKKEQPVDLMATPTGQGSGGKRVNGLPSLIVVFFVLLAVGGIAYVTHLRSQNKIVPGATQPLDQKKEGRSASQMANEATSKWLSGIIPSDAQPGRGLPDMPDVQETKKTNEKEPAANTFSNANAKFSVPVDPYFEDRIRIRERRTQALEAALQSKVGIQMSELRSRQTTARDVTAQLADTRQRIASMGDPTSAYQSRLTQQNGPSGTDGLYRSAATGKNDVRQFEQTDSWNLDSQVQAPASPYMLRTGFVIPATMISGINSDLPGQPKRLGYGNRPLPPHSAGHAAHRRILKRCSLRTRACPDGMATPHLPRRQSSGHSRHARSRQRWIRRFFGQGEQSLVPHHFQRLPHVRRHCRRRHEPKRRQLE